MIRPCRPRWPAFRAAFSLTILGLMIPLAGCVVYPDAPGYAYGPGYAPYAYPAGGVVVVGGGWHGGGWHDGGHDGGHGGWNH